MKMLCRVLMAVLALPLSVAVAHPAQTDSLVIRFANRTRMVIYAPDKSGIQALSNYDLNKIVREMSMKLDSLPNGETAISQDGGRYLRDTVLVITRKKNGVAIVIKDKDSTRTDSTRNWRDYVRDVRKNKHNRNTWGRGVDIQVGLNTLLTHTQTPGYTSQQYELRPLGSRYLAVALKLQPTLIHGKTARLSVYTGLEGVWNNYMFDNNRMLTRGPSAIGFMPAAEPLKKSKLTTFSLQLPVVPRVSFYNASGRKTFHIGVGGFIGYRLDSYTRVKAESGSNHRDHDRYYLNDFRYGLVGHVGILSTNLFVKYDMNSLFQAGTGPNVRSLSFGLTF